MSNRDAVDALSNRQYVDRKPCTRPPEGWWCDLAAGHDGPCPTRAIFEDAGFLWGDSVSSGSAPEANAEALARVLMSVYEPDLDWENESDIDLLDRGQMVETARKLAAAGVMLRLPSEFAVPVQPQLPTEPGAYQGEHGGPFLLNRAGEWFDCDGTPSFGHGNAPEDYAPLFPLVPESVGGVSVRETALRDAVPLPKKPIARLTKYLAERDRVEALTQWQPNEKPDPKGKVDELNNTVLYRTDIKAVLAALEQRSKGELVEGLS